MINLDHTAIERSKSEIARSAQDDDVLNGRVLLSDGEEYPCVGQKFSARFAEIIASASVKVGQVVVCYFDQVGILPGRAIATTSSGFVVAFQIKSNRRDKVAEQLESWTKSCTNATELRRAPRIVPFDRDVQVRLGEHIVLPGTILNISRSGAAIRLDTPDGPFVGALVRVGERFAAVVRLLNNGIAVQFIVPLSPENFDEHVRL